jgi:hypothetical protein
VVSDRYVVDTTVTGTLSGVDFHRHAPLKNASGITLQGTLANGQASSWGPRSRREIVT